MLFGKKSKEIEGVSLMGMNHFPFKGYKYLMWCGKMIYRNDMYDRRQKEWPTDAYLISRILTKLRLTPTKKTWIIGKLHRKQSSTIHVKE